MNTPEQVLQIAREEFKLIWGEAPKGTLKCDKGEQILSWHASTLQSFIEAEILRLEDMKIIRNEKGCYVEDGIIACEYDECEHYGYNKAKDETIKHLKELLVTLKN